MLQIFLLGQPEFRERLNGSDRLEQLRQRVIAIHHLDPMEPDEVEPIYRPPAALAGWQGNPDFAEKRFAALYRAIGRRAAPAEPARRARDAARRDRARSTLIDGGARQRGARRRRPRPATRRPPVPCCARCRPKPRRRAGDPRRSRQRRSRSHRRDRGAPRGTGRGAAPRADAAGRLGRGRRRGRGRAAPRRDMTPRREPHAATACRSTSRNGSRSARSSARSTRPTGTARQPRRAQHRHGARPVRRERASRRPSSRSAGSRTRHPALIRRIADAGHEIASHGWDHQRVFTMTRRRVPRRPRARARRAGGCGGRRGHRLSRAELLDRPAHALGARGARRRRLCLFVQRRAVAPRSLWLAPTRRATPFARSPMSA